MQQGKAAVYEVKRDRDDLKKPLTEEEKENMTPNDIAIRNYKA